MPLVWGTVLLSNVFSRAATPNSFRSRSSKADSARHRGTNYVIKDQQLQEIGWPKEPTCRGACALYLSGPYSPSCSQRVWQKCHGQLFSSGSLTWPVSFCLKVFPNGSWKQKSDELTADPTSLPQTALLSLSLRHRNTGLRHVWVWFVLCPCFSEEPLGKEIKGEGNTWKTSLRFTYRVK